MKAILLLTAIFCASCTAWTTSLGKLALAGSPEVDLYGEYAKCEAIANVNSTTSKFGRIGSVVLVAAQQASIALSMELRMYAVKTADLWHTHTPYEVLCVAAGSGMFQSQAGDMWAMGPGDCTLMTESEAHYFTSYGTNTTGDYTVLINAFLPAPFQRTDLANMTQGPIMNMPVRTTWAEGNFGTNGGKTQALSSIKTSTQLMSNNNFTVWKIVGTDTQVFQGGFANSDIEMIVMTGNITVVVGSMTYNLPQKSFFVVPHGTNFTVTASGDVSLFTIVSPPVTGAPITFMTPASSDSQRVAPIFVMAILALFAFF